MGHTHGLAKVFLPGLSGCDVFDIARQVRRLGQHFLEKSVQQFRVHIGCRGQIGIILAQAHRSFGLGFGFLRRNRAGRIGQPCNDFRSQRIPGGRRPFGGAEDLSYLLMDLGLVRALKIGPQHQDPLIQKTQFTHLLAGFGRGINEPEHVVDHEVRQRTEGLEIQDLRRGPQALHDFYILLTGRPDSVVCRTGIHEGVGKSLQIRRDLSQLISENGKNVVGAHGSASHASQADNLNTRTDSSNWRE